MPEGQLDVGHGRDNGFAQRLFDGLGPRYDLLAELLSFGQNRRWRQAMVDSVAPGRPPACSVLDVATGTAGVPRLLTRRTPATVTGVDLTEHMLRCARRRIATDDAAGRIRLAVAHAERLPFPDDSFDALTFTYLLRYVAEPRAVLAGLARVVWPGGVVASLEFAVPRTPWWHAAWWAYTRAVLPLAGLVTGGRAWFEVGRFLGPSISEHYRRYPIQRTVADWRAAGLEAVEARTMSLGGGLVMTGRKGS